MEQPPSLNTLRYGTCMAESLAAHLNLSLSRIVTAAHSKTSILLFYNENIEEKDVQHFFLTFAELQTENCSAVFEMNYDNWSNENDAKEARSWMPAERNPCSAKLRRAGCIPAPLLSECCVRKSYSI